MPDLRLSDLDPRLRLMVELLLRNAAAIRAPRRGVLELHFHGRHVNARLVAVEAIGLDGPEDQPAKAG